MKIALITGAAGGIGYATVEKFAAEGFCVAAMDLVPADRAAEKMARFGDKVMYFVGDLSKAESRQAFVDAAIARFGRIDVLVNVAGVAPRQRNDILGMTEESYDFVMGVNTKGTFFLTQLVANRMIAQEAVDGVRGYIVNISSMSAYTSSTNRGEYCISKAGVAMATKLWAVRLAGAGIPVYEVRPGVVHSDMTAVVTAKYDKLIAEGLTLQPRWGEPDDVGRAVAALATGAFGYSTGQVVNVDGGMTVQRL